MSDISNLVTYAKENPTEYKEIALGKIHNYKAQEITKQTQVIVKGTTKLLTTDGIRHALGRHSNPVLEAKNNQIALKDEDFDKIPEIFNNPDYLTKGNPSSNGRSTNAVVFIKKFKGHLYHVVACIKGENLVFTTMYIKK